MHLINANEIKETLQLSNFAECFTLVVFELEHHGSKQGSALENLKLDRIYRGRYKNKIVSRGGDLNTGSYRI